MTRLSVNINKVATLRNARGGNMPDVQRFAVDCELFGAQGITVHPRPDERHIRKEDVYQLKSMVTTELNVEGNPTDEFLALLEDIKPTTRDAISIFSKGWSTSSTPRVSVSASSWIRIR